MSSLDKGTHIIDILNTLELDLMTLTKCELSYFEDEITLHYYEAAFPIISSNFFGPSINSDLEGILTSLIVQKNNIKVGFISILDKEVVEEYLLKRVGVFEPRQIIQ
jgi:2',3'-cyclic-nucleotide 2'-phosphodiesterase (5'-nucleotidase family)